MTNWEHIISFESLYRAHRKARLLKRHKKEVILFEANLSENIWALHYDLKYNKYQLGEYHKFMIYDPKEREIQAISYKDRVVQHSICDNYLMPLLNRYLIYDNCACRKGRGTSFAIKRLRQFMVEHYKKHKNKGYVVKIDVSKYFPNIDHNILKGFVAEVVKDKDILNLLYKILDSFNPSIGKGLPMGNQTSQAFALLYLNKLDRFFKEVLQVKHYVRYMDDIIILTDTKFKAKQCLYYAKTLLEKYLLKLNPKSQIMELKNGVQFLGWYFKVSESGKIVQKLRHANKVRVLEKVRIKKKLKSRTKLNETLTSYKGFFCAGMAFRFYKRVIDMCDG